MPSRRPNSSTFATSPALWAKTTAFTRTRDHLEGFADCLAEADVVVLTDIYAAGEAPIDGITIERLVALTRAQRPERPVFLEPDTARLAALVTGMAGPGDLILTLGAGSITRVSHEIAARIVDAAARPAS